MKKLFLLLCIMGSFMTPAQACDISINVCPPAPLEQLKAQMHKLRAVLMEHKDDFNAIGAALPKEDIDKLNNTVVLSTDGDPSNVANQIDEVSTSLEQAEALLENLIPNLDGIK